MLAPCDESTVESAQADEPSGEVGMPPAVQSQNHQTSVQSSSAEDAGELKLSVSAEAQKDANRVQFSGEPYSQGESSDCGGRSGLAKVDPEQTEFGVSVSMESPVEIARDAHQEHNSNTSGGAETDNATPGIVLTEMNLSAERPSVDTDIAEPVASVDRFAPLFGDHAGFHARVTSTSGARQRPSLKRRYVRGHGVSSDGYPGSPTEKCGSRSDGHSSGGWAS
jgi:hypothetical protein